MDPLGEALPFQPFQPFQPETILIPKGPFLMGSLAEEQTPPEE